MKFYWIDALAPLVFRSGKPFGTQSDTDDIIFPLPSAAAGLIRTVFARQKADFNGEFDSEKLQKIPSNGLFLAQMLDDEKVDNEKDNSGSLKIFVPKPADCMYLKDNTETQQNQSDDEENKVRLVRLSPREYDEGCGSDLPKGLLPVQMPVGENDKSKPQSGKQFWLLSDYFKWLNGEELTFDDVNENGVNLPSPDVRTHVAIDGKTLAGQDGLLFQTAAYDLANGKKAHHQGWENKRLGFVIATPENLQNDLVKFGGEGRLSRIEHIENIENIEKIENIEDIVDMNTNIFRLPEKMKIVGNKIKLTLLTPAIFKNGWQPAWLKLNHKNEFVGTLPHTNLTVKLCAAAIDRWQPVSGYDLAKNQPKPMRKAVSAGAVYWFEILEGQANDLIEKLHFQSICDDEQERLDGFGVVAISEWKD